MGNGEKSGSISPVLSSTVAPKITICTEDILSIWLRSLVQPSGGSRNLS